MNYAIPADVALFIPSLATNSLIADEAGQKKFILQACSIIDGALGRSLEIIPYYDEEVSLDQNLSGSLTRKPFRGWIDSTAQLYYFGNGNGNSANAVTLADFSVDKQAGIISNLRLRAGHHGGGDNGFVSMKGGAHAYESPYAANLQQYHRASVHVANDNSKPYVLRASYYSGWFVERTVNANALTGDTSVTVDDVSFLERGRESYFTTDVPDNAPLTDRRITEVDVDNKVVSFTPALEYDMTVDATTKLRMVDKQVRAAVCDVIADVLTYPSNTFEFWKGLGKRDLEKRWVRLDHGYLPQAAADKLRRYR